MRTAVEGFTPERDYDPNESPEQIPPNPYPGLSSFGEEDADLFFGRESLIVELSERVQNNSFVPIVGASGSGKSSLIFAGLVPKLKREGHWLIARMRPKDDLLSAIGSSLATLRQPSETAGNEITKNWAAGLDEGDLDLISIVNELIGQHPGSRVLLILDQFEEFYTLGFNEAQQKQFLASLYEAITKTGRQPLLTLLIALRADFFDNALKTPYLNELLSHHSDRMVFRPMNTDELRAVIEEPAKQLGVSFEDGLVQRILDDIDRSPTSLPLLEFALTELWKVQQYSELTHSGYELIGGVKRAIGQYADSIYDVLEAEDKKAAQRIFLQMVRVFDDQKSTRQTISKNQIQEHDWPLITRLVDARLLVSGRDEHDANSQEGTDTIELIHEALIEYWTPLKSWISVERVFRVWLTGLRPKLTDWQKNRSDDLLLRGAPLNEAENQLERQGDQLTQDERKFIEMGLRQQKRKARRRNVLIGSIISGLAVFGVIASLLTGVANEQRDEALRKQSLLLSKLSKDQTEAGKKELGILLALEALPKNLDDPERPYVVEAEAALYQAVLAPGEFKKVDASMAKRPIKFLRHLALSPDGKRFAIVSDQGHSYLWDVDSGEIITKLGLATYINFSPDSTRFVTADSDKVVLWSANTGELISEDNKCHGRVRIVKFLGDSRRLFTVAYQDYDSPPMICLSDSNTGKVIQSITVLEDSERFKDAEINADGSFLAIRVEDKNTDEDKIILWDVTSKNRIRIIKDVQGGGHLQANLQPTLEFSPDGKRFIALLKDNIIGTWNTQDGKKVGSLIGHGGRINHAEFSSSGEFLVTTSNDFTARVWNVKTQSLVSVVHSTNPGARPFQHHSSFLGKSPNHGIQFATFSPDESRILTVATDGIRLSRTQDARKIVDLFTNRRHLFRGSGFYAAFNQTGTRAVTWYNGNLSFWKSNNIARKKAYDGGISKVHNVDFSPDGQLLLSVSENGAATIRNIETGQKVSEIIIDKDGLTQSVYGPQREAFSPVGDQIVTTSNDGAATLWDIKGNRIKILKGHKAYINNIKFNSDGTKFVISSDDGTARLWDRFGNPLLELVGHDNSVEFATFSPNGKQIVTSSSDMTVKLWDANNGHLIKEIQELKNKKPYCCVRLAFSPDGKRLVTSGNGTSNEHYRNRYVRGVTEIISMGSLSNTGVEYGINFNAHLWAIESGVLLNKIANYLPSGAMANILQVLFSPNGKYISIVDGWGSQLWSNKRIIDTNNGKPLAYLTNCPGIIFSTFTNDGGKYLDVTGEGMINVFNGNGDYLVTHYTIERLKYRGSCSENILVTAATLSPDNRYVAIAGADGKIRLFRVYLSTQALVNHAHELVKRELTDDEKEQFLLSDSSSLDEDQSHSTLQSMVRYARELFLSESLQ